jgi:hypothetical protein
MTEGNRALEKLTELLGSSAEADFALAWLWAEGYAIVPICDDKFMLAGDKEDALPDVAEVDNVIPLGLFRRKT